MHCLASVCMTEGGREGGREGKEGGEGGRGGREGVCVCVCVCVCCQPRSLRNQAPESQRKE